MSSREITSLLIFDSPAMLLRMTCKTSYLVDFQEAVNLTAFILLLLHLLSETLSFTLLDGVCTLERPASPPIRFAHIITGVAASGHTHQEEPRRVNTGSYSKQSKQRQKEQPVFVSYLRSSVSAP